MTNVNQAPLPRLSKAPLVRASLVKRRYIKYLALPFFYLLRYRDRLIKVVFLCSESSLSHTLQKAAGGKDDVCGRQREITDRAVHVRSLCSGRVCPVVQSSTSSSSSPSSSYDAQFLPLCSIVHTASKSTNTVMNEGRSLTSNFALTENSMCSLEVLHFSQRGRCPFRIAGLQE